MQLTALLERLPQGSVASVELGDPEADVYTVSFLSMDPTTLREDVLYFGDETLLSLVPESLGVLNCILVDGGSVPQRLREGATLNIVNLTPGFDPFACYNALQACFIESAEVTHVVQRMLAAHFSNRGLQFLIEETAMALGRPIMVIDTNQRYIAYHLADLEEPGSAVLAQLKKETGLGALDERAAAYIIQSGIDSEIARNGGVLERHNANVGANALIAAVMVGGICIAHVMMVDLGKPFTDLDRECFLRLPNFVAQEMQKSVSWNPTTGEMESFFLLSLLGDRHPSESVTQRRLRSIGLHPKPFLYAVCLHAPGEGLDQQKVEMLAGQLRPILHHSVYTRYHQQFVALISRDDGDGLGDYAENVLREVAYLNGLTVGISNVFTSITDMRRGYDQARAAVREGERVAHSIDDNRVFHFYDYAYVHLLNTASRQLNLIDLCHPALLHLASYDEAHGGELMDTLFIYLQVAGSTTRAAKMLNLHKNTMLYRLGRIRKLIGSDLTSGEEQFQLQLSFRVLMFCGMYSPRMKMTRESLRA